MLLSVSRFIRNRFLFIVKLVGCSANIYIAVHLKLFVNSNLLNFNFSCLIYNQKISRISINMCYVGYIKHLRAKRKYKHYAL